MTGLHDRAGITAESKRKSKGWNESQSDTSSDSCLVSRQQTRFVILVEPEHVEGRTIQVNLDDEAILRLAADVIAARVSQTETA
jgi:hypothetical protein